MPSAIGVLPRCVHIVDVQCALLNITFQRRKGTATKIFGQRHQTAIAVHSEQRTLHQVLSVLPTAML